MAKYHLPAGTALITGASSGIGEAFARELAKRGHDLILVARREDRLIRIAGELAAAHGVTVEVLPADLSTADGIARVEGRIRAQDDGLALLVNNAGFNHPGAFHKVDFDHLMAMLQVHLAATFHLSRAALPAMRRRETGAIINVSSAAALLPPTFGNTMYRTTKTALNTFSEDLQVESRRRGIRVQALCPVFTPTEIFDNPGFRVIDQEQIPRFLWTSLDVVVGGSLRALERRRHRVVTVPGYPNWLLQPILRSGLVRAVIGWVLSRRV